MRQLIFILAFSIPAMAQQSPYCQNARGCREEGRRPAGIDSEGHTLSVVKLRYSNIAGNRETSCIPSTRWILLRSKGEKIVSTHEVLKVCQPPPHEIWENTVKVEPNRITVLRSGGAFAGMLTQVYSLSPWRPLSMDFCSVDGDGTWRAEIWDWTSMTGRYHTGMMPDGDPCSFKRSTLSNLVMPMVLTNVDELRKNNTALGTCAMTMDASGQRGFIKSGKPDPKSALELRALMVGEHTLLIAVSGPAATSKDWIEKDQVILWLGPYPGQRLVIPVKGAPTLTRWTRQLPTERLAVMMQVNLPQRSITDQGFSLEYHQRSANRVIGTSQGKSAGNHEWQRTILDKDSAGQHVRCEAVDGKFNVKGPVQDPLVIWQGGLGRPDDKKDRMAQ